MSEKQPVKSTPVRIPDELYVWLKHESVDNRRSLTAEIVHRLEMSRRQQQTNQPSKP